MKLAHFSDVHGQIKNLTIPGDVEGLLSTGDFFPNSSRGIRSKEVAYQTSWFHANKEELFSLFRGLPIACVDGNHDYISLGEMLASNGYPGKVVCVRPDKAQEFAGFQVAGYREIPRIAGEWNGEVLRPELLDLGEAALRTGCNLLMTHTPPAGILSGDYGCPSLANLLAYTEHRVRFHFFGHQHCDFGQVTELGILFSNAATTVNVVEINP